MLSIKAYFTCQEFTPRGVLDNITLKTYWGVIITCSM
jgi:hypothetical protein